MMTKQLLYLSITCVFFAFIACSPEKKEKQINTSIEEDKKSSLNQVNAKKEDNRQEEEEEVKKENFNNHIKEKEVRVEPKKNTTKTTNKIVVDSEKDLEKPKVKEENKTPEAVKNEFSGIRNFSEGPVDLNKGTKLVCLFSLTCEHCQKTYKELCEYKKEALVPNIYILGMGAEFDLDYFFEQSTCKDPYKLMGYDSFLPLLQSDDFPKVVLLKEGQKLGEWDLSDLEENISPIKTAIEKL